MDAGDRVVRDWEGVRVDTRAATILGRFKTWMAAHNAAIMTVLLLVLGAKLIGDAIGGLSS